LRKEQGSDPNRLTNKEKTLLIDSLRASWKLVKVPKALRISRSSYHYQLKSIATERISTLSFAKESVRRS
jgi:hypothetical protein